GHSDSRPGTRSGLQRTARRAEHHDLRKGGGPGRPGHAGRGPVFRRGLCPLSGAAHVDHLGAGWVLPRLGASGMGPHPLVPAQDVAKQDPGKQPGSCWSAAHLQQLLMSSQLSGRLTVLGGKNSPTGKEMFRN
ncbi:Stage V sporulation protein G family protein, partial [Dysosmobacter welbionis]